MVCRVDRLVGNVGLESSVECPVLPFAGCHAGNLCAEDFWLVGRSAGFAKRLVEGPKTGS